MSLWTPGGEHEVPREPAPSPSAPSAPSPGAGPEMGPIDLDQLSPEERAQAEEMIRQMAEAQQRIAEAPVEHVIANHLVGFYELAAIHLQQDPPRFDDAQLAIDALAAVLERLEGRLADAESDLRSLLNNVQMAFVQIREQAEA